MTINLVYVLIKLRVLQEQALVLACGSYGGLWPYLVRQTSDFLGFGDLAF